MTTTQPAVYPARDGAGLYNVPTDLPAHVPMPGSSTRQKLLEAAEALFYEEGFHAVGLDRILRAVGISKQGFYRHFSSKEDLVVEVVRWHDRWWRDQSRQVLQNRAGHDPQRQLEMFIDLLIEVLDGKVFRGCFFINAVAQFPNVSDPIHRAALQAKENIEMMVRDMALQAGADDPVALASELTMLIEGAFATRYLRRAEEVVPVLRRMTAQLLDQHLPARLA